MWVLAALLFSVGFRRQKIFNFRNISLSSAV